MSGMVGIGAATKKKERKVKLTDNLVRKLTYAFVTLMGITILATSFGGERDMRKNNPHAVPAAAQF